jgi:hypothetical protein
MNIAAGMEDTPLSNEKIYAKIFHLHSHIQQTKSIVAL